MLQNKNITKAVSIIIAICLWAYVINVENPLKETTIKNIPIQIINEESLAERGLTIAGDRNYTMSVTIQGQKTDVAKVNKDSFVAVIDVFGYGIGENSIEVDLEAPSKINVISGAKTRISISIEELVSQPKSIKVDAGKDEQGTVGAGKEVVITSIQPEQVMATGAKSLVESVDHVRATMDVQDVGKTEKHFTAKLVAVDGSGETISNITLSADTADVIAKLCDTKEVELETNIVGTPAAGYLLGTTNIPDKITICGTAKDLKDIAKVTAEPISVEGLQASANIPLAINLPEGVFLSASEEEVSATVQIYGTTTSTFTMKGENISVKTKEGYTAVVDTDSVALTVRGSDGLMKNASETDFTAVADATGLEAGTHSVPIEINYEKRFLEVQYAPQQIQITITTDL